MVWVSSKIYLIHTKSLFSYELCPALAPVAEGWFHLVFSFARTQISKLYSLGIIREYDYSGCSSSPVNALILFLGRAIQGYSSH